MEWKTINYRQTADSAQNSAQGQGFDKRIVVSPYTIPEAYRVSSPEPNFLTLQFRYFSPDSSYEEIALEDSIVLSIGKQSGRIFSIRFNLRFINNVGDFRQLFESAISSLRNQFKNERRFKGLVGENLIRQEKQVLENQFSLLNEKGNLSGRSNSAQKGHFEKNTI